MRRQPFGDPGNDEAHDEIQDRSNSQCLEDIEIHRAQTPGLLEQIRIQDDRTQCRILKDNNKLGNRRREHCI